MVLLVLDRTSGIGVPKAFPLPELGLAPVILGLTDIVQVYRIPLVVVCAEVGLMSGAVPLQRVSLGAEMVTTGSTHTSTGMEAKEQTLLPLVLMAHGVRV